MTAYGQCPYSETMPLPVKSERVELRMPAADLKRWRAAATRENMTLSDWIRRACNGALPGGK